MKNNPLQQNFTTFRLLKFALPTTIMMIFFAVYTMVDGLFISNIVGENAFSAINIVFPAIALIIAIGTMISTGGSAVVSKLLGEGKTQEARQSFTLITLFGVCISVVVMGCGIIFIQDIIKFLGSTPLLDEFSQPYLQILIWFSPFTIMQILSQMFFVVDGKPKLGLIIGVTGGLTNILLDYVFIVLLHMGVAGAALGTGLGICVSAVSFLVYFSRRKQITFIS